jgi:hypothetical protein
MSRSANPLTSFTLLEDRLTALLTRIDTAAGVLTEQAAREVASGAKRNGDTAGSNSNSAALDHLRQLTELLERQESTTRDAEASQAEWLAPVQQQLERIEQRIDALRNTDNKAATFS